MDVIVKDRIVTDINQSGWIEATKLPHIANLELADSFSGEELSVEILLGQDFAYLFLEGELNCDTTPIVQHSVLGCIISGPLEPKVRNVLNSATVKSDLIESYSTHETDSIQQEYTEFVRKNVFTIPCGNDQEEREYNEIFLKDYADKIEFKDGRYAVPLPWKPDHPVLRNNIELCQSRLKQVVNRLRRLNLVDAYCAVMDESIRKGYVSETGKSINESKHDSHFMPHFPVLRDSETTPVRIVIDASSGEPSLNSCLFEGPNLISDLSELLLLFRSRKIGLVADIARAFLSISLLEEDRKFVQFLWYENNDITKRIVPYRCNTVIFGNVISPFALGITLKKHLDSYGDCTVARDLAGKLYVDNLITAVDNSELAIDYYQKTLEIMQDGAFLMRQWASNEPKINQRFQDENNGTKSEIVSLLGLKWNSTTDSISLANKNVQAGDYSITKRSVLSKSSAIYDPLGLVGPLGSKSKAFLQKLWLLNKDWDEELTLDEQLEWAEISRDLSQSHGFGIPRWLGFDRNVPINFVVFCDACPKTALGCVAYATQGDTVRLIGSKNRIVSQKTPNSNTVPKLELQAMALGASYGHSLKEI
ncbi:uncharacterized protein LOC141904293 [Tubulanus polymorphus]|uniref:uncharacterized protein LOC141904293 n=1 Tax=Tubulanus polymorphus TaxID=672921 RepID=UPI003DA4CE56